MFVMIKISLYPTYIGTDCQIFTPRDVCGATMRWAGIHRIHGRTGEWAEIRNGSTNIIKQHARAYMHGSMHIRRA